MQARRLPSVEEREAERESRYGATSASRRRFCFVGSPTNPTRDHPTCSGRRRCSADGEVFCARCFFCVTGSRRSHHRDLPLEERTQPLRPALVSLGIAPEKEPHSVGILWEPETGIETRFSARRWLSCRKPNESWGVVPRAPAGHPGRLCCCSQRPHCEIFPSASCRLNPRLPQRRSIPQWSGCNERRRPWTCGRESGASRVEGGLCRSGGSLWRATGASPGDWRR